MKLIRVLIPVMIAAAALSAWTLLRRGEFLYAGTVEATEVDISSRLISTIASFDAREGRPVKAGEVMVRLTCEEIRLAADIADRDFKRAQKLRDGAMTEEAYDRLRYKRDDAQVRLDWCVVKAPADATVLSVYHETGEAVSPGTKLLTLAALSEVWAYVYVPQPLLAKLSLDMEVQGTIPEMKGKVFTGRVSRISDEAEFTPKNVQTRSERTRLVFGVKVSFPNPDRVLKPGMTIEVHLPE
ncbi:MAG: efflux RND transporter periplasmic adaptor subunit [Elusimicrobia bacterium]|nr:efflux RND transporter periplasmic adaptor subunit [Elusimicrobiota bacterium]